MLRVRRSFRLAAATLIALSGCVAGTPSPDADAAMPVVVGHVVLQGNCAQPIANDGGIAFPDTAVMVQTGARVIDLVNDGSVDIDRRIGIDWMIEGPDAADFSVGGEAESDEDIANCTFVSVASTPGLAVGTACHFAVRFQPTSPGVKQANLHILKSGEVSLDQTFPLHATAVPPPVGLYASTPDLYLTLPTAGAGGFFQITNGGTTPVTLGDAVVGAPLMFSSWNCPATLTPGGACTVVIGYPPANARCPASEFSTTMTSLSVPLEARGTPAMLSIGVQAAGSVLVAPGGMTCTQDHACSVVVGMLETFTLTAIPNTGAHFIGWVDATTEMPASCGTSPTCTVQVGPTSVDLIAMFTTTTVKSIAVTIAGTGTVTASGGGFACTSSCVMYAEPGDSLNLEATTPGVFDGWTGDCTNADPDCNLGTIIDDRAVTATFTP